MVKFFEEKHIFSVSELTNLLDKELSRAFADILVQGEVGDYSKSKNGHIYFKLKDENASIKVMIFRNNALRLKFEIENGMLLIVRGKIGLYTKGGDLQLYAEDAEPSGIGALLLSIEQSKKRLQKDGLLDEGRKRKIPPYPQRVGVVTSLEGAAIRDFISTLKRRGANIEVIIAPSSVQGKEAPDELKKGLKTLYKMKDIDLIVLTRGGGSMEDLMAFNDESLARVVAESPVPIISAVGHEIDLVLTDLTADQRAATPSTAAEIISQNYFVAKETLERTSKKIIEAVNNQIYQKNSRVTIFDQNKVERTIKRSVEKMEERIDRAFSSTFYSIKRKCDQYENKINYLIGMASPKTIYRSYDTNLKKVKSIYERISSTMISKIKITENNFKNKMALIAERNPMNILSKGYSIVKNREGKAIRMSSEVNLDEILNVILYKGELKIKVEDKSN